MKRLYFAVLLSCLSMMMLAQGAPTGPFGPREPLAEPKLIVLENGPVTMTVDANRGGKIMSLKHGEREIISQSRFPNSFGSTFWTSPQKEWNWPPVPQFDSKPYTIELQEPAHLTLCSEVAERLGFRIRKDFTTDATDGAFVVTYTIVNEGKEARRVAPWEITRVANNADGLIFFEAPADSIWPSGLLTFEDAHGAAWYHTNEVPDNTKVNADARGWLAYCAGGLLLVKRFQDLSHEEPAPGEAEVQVYVNRGRTFIELESQGAYTMLQPGKSLSWTVRWYLMPVSKTSEPSADLVKLAK